MKIVNTNEATSEITNATHGYKYGFAFSGNCVCSIIFNINCWKIYTPKQLSLSLSNKFHFDVSECLTSFVERVNNSATPNAAHANLIDFEMIKLIIYDSAKSPPVLGSVFNINFQHKG